MRRIRNSSNACNGKFPSWYINATCFKCYLAFCFCQANALINYDSPCSSNALDSARHLCRRELGNEIGEFLSPFERNRVVVAGSDATNAPVTLEASETQISRLLEEGLFGFVHIASLIFLVSHQFEQSKKDHDLPLSRGSRRSFSIVRTCQGQFCRRQGGHQALHKSVVPSCLRLLPVRRPCPGM